MTKVARLSVFALNGLTVNPDKLADLSPADDWGEAKLFAHDLTMNGEAFVKDGRRINPRRVVSRGASPTLEVHDEAKGFPFV